MQEPDLNKSIASDEPMQQSSPLAPPPVPVPSAAAETPIVLPLPPLPDKPVAETNIAPEPPVNSSMVPPAAPAAQTRASWRLAPADNTAPHNRTDASRGHPVPHNNSRFLSRESSSDETARAAQIPPVRFLTCSPAGRTCGTARRKPGNPRTPPRAASAFFQ